MQLTLEIENKKLYDSLVQFLHSAGIAVISSGRKKKQKTALRERSFGSMKGLVKYMSDDFNEPLDDFKEYMPQ